MHTYRFSGSLAIDELRVRRVESERELEEVIGSFSHHAHPNREMLDVMKFDTFVKAGRPLSSAEQAAFTCAMNRCLRRFRHEFEEALQDERRKVGDECAI